MLQSPAVVNTIIIIILNYRNLYFYRRVDDRHQSAAVGTRLVVALHGRVSTATTTVITAPRRTASAAVAARAAVVDNARDVDKPSLGC